MHFRRFCCLSALETNWRERQGRDGICSKSPLQRGAWIVSGGRVRAKVGGVELGLVSRRLRTAKAHFVEAIVREECHATCGWAGSMSEEILHGVRLCMLVGKKGGLRRRFKLAKGVSGTDEEMYILEVGTSAQPDRYKESRDDLQELWSLWTRNRSETGRRLE